MSISARTSSAWSSVSRLRACPGVSAGRAAAAAGAAQPGQCLGDRQLGVDRRLAVDGQLGLDRDLRVLRLQVGGLLRILQQVEQAFDTVLGLQVQLPAAHAHR